MPWLEGVVTYSATKLNDDGHEYGMMSIEGVFCFCSPKILPAAGQEIRVFVQANNREVNGQRSTSLNALVIQPKLLGDEVELLRSNGRAGPVRTRLEKM